MDIVIAAEKPSIAGLLSRHLRCPVAPQDIRVKPNPDETGMPEMPISEQEARDAAAYPLDYVKNNKFWPSVRRVDDAYGDRNLICTCAPIEAYMEV